MEYSQIQSMNLPYDIAHYSAKHQYWRNVPKKCNVLCLKVCRDAEWNGYTESHEISQDG